MDYLIKMVIIAIMLFKEIWKGKKMKQIHVLCWQSVNIIFPINLKYSMDQFYTSVGHRLLQRFYGERVLYPSIMRF